MFFSALHLAIIYNHQDVVLQFLDVLPHLPPAETPVVDCLNIFKQVIWKVIQYHFLLYLSLSSPVSCSSSCHYSSA